MSRLPSPPAETPETMRQSDIQRAAPAVVRAVAAILDSMEAEGHEPIVWEVLRTQERQNYLWKFGRLHDDGRGIVTYSEDAEDTWHYYGCAVDIICRRRRWDATPAFWHSLQRHAVKHGMLWGGDWNRNGRSDDETFRDFPHIQWGKCRRSPSPSAAKLFAEGGFQAVWSAVGAL